MSPKPHAQMTITGLFKPFLIPFSPILACALALFFSLPSQASPGDTIRVSLPTIEASYHSLNPDITADGRYIVFESFANNLVSEDTNNAWDIFLHDAQSGITTRISEAADGTEGNGNFSQAPAISADGQYVVFQSDSSNLVSGDTNGVHDIFLHDTQTSTTTRISVSSNGTQGNGSSYNPVISADGRYVAFNSLADNLVFGDWNGAEDIFIYDTQTGITTRASVTSAGLEANGSSQFPALSANGRYVAFWSEAADLVDGDTNSSRDVFIHDRQTGLTSRISTASDGTEGNWASEFPTISADGRYVAFQSKAANLVDGDTNGRDDVFLHDTQTGTTTRISVASNGTEGNRYSQFPDISADGRYVAFQADASNLVSEDTNFVFDTFVHDTQTGVTTRVSVASNGTQGADISQAPAISADGQHVAFHSFANNLVGDSNEAIDVFVHDMENSLTTRVSVPTLNLEGNGNSSYQAISANGRYIAFESEADNLVSNDTNGARDVFVRDTISGATTRVSVASDGTEGHWDSYGPAISADGRYVGFYSIADNLVSGDNNGNWDVFVHDTQTGVTTRVSVASDGTEGNGGSYHLDISDNGRYVAFWSLASNLVSGDTSISTRDVFIHDTQTGTTTIASVDSDGTLGNGDSGRPTISADGRYVAYWSQASNLVDGDTNNTYDVFVHDTQTGTTSRISVASDGTEANDGSFDAAFSISARYVAFSSYASNLVSGDTNGVLDVFLHDMQTGSTTRISVNADGVEGNGESASPTLSADGRYLTFQSAADNLVDGDTNGRHDVFIYDTVTGIINRISNAPGGAQGNDGSYYPTISADGHFVAFYSAASNLVNGDTNGATDIFLHEIDMAAPTVITITRADPNPTTANSVNFIILFSEAVMGVDDTDFNLTTTGSINGAIIESISGSGATYTVRVITGEGHGTLRLNIPVTADISDLANNPLTGLPFTNGEAYTVQTGIYLPLIAR